MISGIGRNSSYRPTFEVADWCDPARVPAPQWTNEVASTAGQSATLALFAGNSALVTRMLDAVPEAHQHNSRVLLAATLESVFAGDFDLAESRLAAVAPADDLDAFYLAHNKAQIFHNRLHTDRVTDAEYRQIALAHCAQLVSRAREQGAPLTLAGTLCLYGYCLDGAGDINGAVAVESEAIELSEKHGAWFLVDAARAGLVYSLAQLTANEPGQRHDTVATLHATIEAAITRRNHFVIADCLSFAVERVLWDAGDHRTAALLGIFGKLHVPLNALFPSAVDPALLGADALAEIEAEAAKLDIETAGSIALAALAQILATG